MVRRLISSAFLSTALCLPAFAITPITPAKPEAAAAGTAEEARSLEEVLRGFVTAVPFERGMLRIEPDPAGQRITLDPAALLSELAGSPVHFAPLSFVVSERADGNWNVFTDAPVDIAADVDMEGQRQRFEYKQNDQEFKGVFSPALAAFVQGEGTAWGTTNVQSDAFSRSLATIRSTALRLTGRPGTNGGADLDFRQTYADYQQTSTVEIPAEDGADPASFGFEASAAEVETTAALKDARTRAIFDLYALVLRNASALERDAKATLAGPFGAELKPALGAVLPLWSSLAGEAAGRDLRVTSLYGELGIADARQTMRFSGVATDASFDIDMNLQGIRATSAMLPAWTATLMPQEIAIGFAVSGVDLKTPAETALAELDFGQDPPLSPDAQARIGASFDPTRIRSQLKPSRIRSADLDIALSGDFVFAEGKPAANVAVEAAGLDKAIATLQAAAAGQPELHQAVGLLQFAKGVGRPTGEDRLEWIVAAAADGSVTVNGTMLKGPDPAADPGISEDRPTDTLAPDGENDDL